MILLIRDQLTCPPSSVTIFRDLTLYCYKDFCSAILIESADPDPFYRWLKPKGGMDYIADIVRPGSERGLHLDLEENFSPTVVIDRIAQENLHFLIWKVQFYASINGYRGAC